MGAARAVFTSFALAIALLGAVPTLGAPSVGLEAAEVSADGAVKGSTPNTKKSSNKDGAAPAIPGLQQRVKETLQNSPILAANTVFQLPLAVDPRSMNLGAHRRMIYVTDGKLHNKVEVPWWKFWEDEPEPFPYGYLLKPNGEMARKLLFKGRTLQPYGIAESPEDGRVAVTFYQGPQVEVWESDLSMAWSYNEQSIHPSLPFFLSNKAASALGYPHGSLAVPFDVMDVLNDKDNGTVQCWVYSKDAGKRVELFRRRQFQGMNLPHSISITVTDQLGLPLPEGSSNDKQNDKQDKQSEKAFMFAAGLQEWIWEEGRGRGMWLVKPKWKEESSPVRLNVYQLIGDAKAAEVVGETGERWRQDNGYRTKQPKAGSAEIAPFIPKNGLRKLASYRFSGICRWPLFALVAGQETVKDETSNTTSTVAAQYAITGCSDSDWIEVLRLTDNKGRLIVSSGSTAAGKAAEQASASQSSPSVPAGNRLDEPVSVSYIRRPYGITHLGAIVADPVTNGQTIALLDRSRKKIFSAPFPFPPGKHDTEEPLPAMPVAVAAAKESPGDAKLAEVASKARLRARHPILRNGEGLPITSATIPLP